MCYQQTGSSLNRRNAYSVSRKRATRCERYSIQQNASDAFSFGLKIQFVSVTTKRSFKSYLPAEHGAWFITLEPILLGMIVTPSWAGLYIGLAMYGILFLRQPLLKWKHQRRWSDILWMSGFVIVCFLSAIAISTWQIVLFLVPCVFFGTIALGLEMMGQRRSLLAEILATLSVGAAASMIGLGGKLSLQTSLLLWLIVLLRLLPTMLTVRMILRIKHQQPHHPVLSYVSHIIAVTTVSYLVWQTIVPMGVGFIIVLLSLRGIWLLVHPPLQANPKQIGVQEAVIAIASIFILGILLRSS